MSLNQASNLSLSQSSFQPFDSLPDEVLLLLLDQLTPFQRCLILSICKKWNHTILQRKSWWQYLDIPEHLPFSTAISILQTFNSRSNFTLKHVTIQTLMETSEEVDEVFVELKKSSGHVKLLFLNQSDFVLTTRRDAQQLLPKLDTFYCMYSPDVKQDLQLMWDERNSLGIVDEEEKGLQLLHVAFLAQLEPDDLEWFSKLMYLSVERTDSVKDVRHILEICKGTLRTLRLDLWTFDRDLEGPDLIHADDGFKKINLPDLKFLFTPDSEASAAALSRLINVGGQERIEFFGYVHPLLHFDFPSLEQVHFRMYESKALEELSLNEEESKLKTILFFEGNPSISCLGLDRVAGLQDGENFHLDFILHSLSPKRTSGSSDESKREFQSFLLPKLQQLTIDTPYAFNKKLLKEFWETRKAICKDFFIQVRIEGKVFSIDRSEGEEWLDETESCE